MTSAENTPKDPEMEIPKELPKRFFDDLQDFIAKTFEPQYITHKKFMLGKKLKCYEDAGDDIVKYFGCLEGIDAQLREQQIYLQSKYIKIEDKKKECDLICKSMVSENNKFFRDCEQKCEEEMKNQCVDLYTKFYERVLKPLETDEPAKDKKGGQ